MHASRFCPAVKSKLPMTVYAGSSQAKPSGTPHAVPQDEIFQLLQTAVYTPAQDLARQSSIQQLARMVARLQEPPGAANVIAVFSARYIVVIVESYNCHPHDDHLYHCLSYCRLIWTAAVRHRQVGMSVSHRASQLGCNTHVHQQHSLHHFLASSSGMLSCDGRHDMTTVTTCCSSSRHYIVLTTGCSSVECLHGSSKCQATLAAVFSLLVRLCCKTP